MGCNTFDSKEDITIEFYYTKAKYKNRQAIKIKQVYRQFDEIIIVSENRVEYLIKDLTDFSF